MGKITDFFDGIVKLCNVIPQAYIALEKNVGTKAILTTFLVGGWVICTATGIGVSAEYGAVTLAAASMYIQGSFVKNAQK